MPILRRWSPKKSPIPVTFECPFYEELLTNKERGCLSRDFEAHALWEYYGLASIQYERAKSNLVDESELSEVFDPTRARLLFTAVSNKHGCKPQAMIRFWPMIMRQRIALGGDDTLPDQFKFRYWGH